RRAERARARGHARALAPVRGAVRAGSGPAGDPRLADADAPGADGRRATGTASRQGLAPEPVPGPRGRPDRDLAAAPGRRRPLRADAVEPPVDRGRLQS